MKYIYPTIKLFYENGISYYLFDYKYKYIVYFKLSCEGKKSNCIYHIKWIFWFIAEIWHTGSITILRILYLAYKPHGSLYHFSMTIFPRNLGYPTHNFHFRILNGIENVLFHKNKKLSLSLLLQLCNGLYNTGSLHSSLGANPFLFWCHNKCKLAALPMAFLCTA